jgi:hypothetical protein
MKDVRFWPKADIITVLSHVRFRGYSGHGILRASRPLLTQSGRHFVQHPLLPRPNLLSFGRNWRNP